MPRNVNALIGPIGVGKSQILHQIVRDWTYDEAADGEGLAINQLSGPLRRHVDLTSGRFALIERSRDFTHGPWRPALEHQVGKTVPGLMCADGINWSIGAGRGSLI